MNLTKKNFLTDIWHLNFFKNLFCSHLNYFKALTCQISDHCNQKQRNNTEKKIFLIRTGHFKGQYFKREGFFFQFFEAPLRSLEWQKYDSEKKIQKSVTNLNLTKKNFLTDIWHLNFFKNLLCFNL